MPKLLQIVCTAAAILVASPASAARTEVVPHVTPTDEAAIPAPFRGEAQGSPIRVDYRDWSGILKATVTKGARSSRSYAPTEQPPMGTRLTIGDTNSFRNEGNRLDFKAFTTGKNLEIVDHIRHEFERLPDVAPLSTWTKTEQLAYWLNLYNITVVEQVAKDYPIRRLNRLKFGRHSMWKKKLLKVSGVPLSLDDIRNILVHKWDTTLVVYGLFQGYVGGPNLPNEAYTSDNVYDLLKKNAREFVNSNRGTMMRGSTLQVSDFYKDNAELFPDFQKDLRAHLLHLVDPDWRDNIEGARRIRAKTHDYYIADVYGGGEIPHSATNTNSTALMSASVSVDASGGTPISQSFEVYSGGNNYSNGAIEMRFPPAAVHYIQKIRKEKSLRPGHVDLEEIIDESPSQRVQGAKPAPKPEPKPEAAPGQKSEEEPVQKPEEKPANTPS